VEAARSRCASRSSRRPIDERGGDGNGWRSASCVGPNAIIQVLAAARALESEARVRQLFRAAGLEAYVDEPPKAMVDEREVAALHRGLQSGLGAERAETIAWLAGWRTGDYILAHRIPRAAQRILYGLPASLASRVLLAAIARHAWTFAGSARVEIEPGRPALIRLYDGAIAADPAGGRTVCAYYAAVFERLFTVLIDPRIEVVETECAASSVPACVFRIARSEMSLALRPAPRDDATRPAVT
jgi:divinyl protochlorophyllide a 8-vinyl-reductase